MAEKARVAVITQDARRAILAWQHQKNQPHSSEISRTLANIRRRNEWSPAVEDIIDSMLGQSSGFYKQMSETFAKIQPRIRSTADTHSENADNWPKDEP